MPAAFFFARRLRHFFAVKHIGILGMPIKCYLCRLEKVNGLFDILI